MAMKIRIVGFGIELSKNICIAELHGHLRNLRDQEVPLNKVPRMIYVGQRGDYYTGLFLTIRDHRLFVKLNKSPGGVDISARQLDEGDHLFEFNLYALHKKTLRGVYMQYHQSCSVNQFCVFLRDRHNDLKKQLIQGRVQQGKSEKSAKKHYRGYFRWDIVMKQEDFEETVKTLDSINSFGFSFSTYQPEQKAGVPLQTLVRSERHGVSYAKGAATPDIVKDIFARVAANRPKRAMVTGKDLNGAEQIVRLVEHPNSLHEYDYDKIAGHLNFKAENFNDAKVTLDLIKFAEANKALIEYTEVGKDDQGE